MAEEDADNDEDRKTTTTMVSSAVPVLKRHVRSGGKPNLVWLGQSQGTPPRVRLSATRWRK